MIAATSTIVPKDEQRSSRCDEFDHAAYSTDLALSDFHAFTQLLGKTVFHNEGSMKKAATYVFVMGPV